MRAVRFHEYGDVDRLALEEVAEPAPGEGEIAVRVRAAGVNPIDWKVLHGSYGGGQPLTEPRGLGFDLAGVVETVGPGVTDFAPGDEVLGIPASPSFAELALARPEGVVRKPAGMAWEVAGGLGVVAGTAYAVLAELAPEPGETLLIIGASGAVGSLATQLAVAGGARVVGTAGASKLERVRALGATPVEYGDGLAARLREAAPEGLDAVFDASGHGEVAAAAEVKGNVGRMLAIAGSPQATELGVPFHAGGGGERQREALEAVVGLIESRRIEVPVAGVFELSQVAEALRQSEHDHPAGKLVVIPA